MKLAYCVPVHASHAHVKDAYQYLLLLQRLISCHCLHAPSISDLLSRNSPPVHDFLDLRTICSFSWREREQFLLPKVLDIYIYIYISLDGLILNFVLSVFKFQELDQFSNDTFKLFLLFLLLNNYQDYCRPMSFEG